ncbi:MAG: ribonuclease PH [Negativicutes bacterium]|nr:ribonuclease PH [Negativicutes bacterium]
MTAARHGGRNARSLRRIVIERGRLKFADGSALVRYGDTEVICAATVEDRVPLWLRGKGKGWLTAEYSMLPRATQERNVREITRGRPSGRTLEIQRLIGRALRSVLDCLALGERTVIVDCDVIQADGGTRTAAISGGFVAMVEALHRLKLPTRVFPVTDFLAAVSVGMIDGEVMLDLSFAEDSVADVDLNVVMNGQGEIVEIQGTAEQRPFSRSQLDQMLTVAEQGIAAVFEVQKDALQNLSWLVGAR